MIAATHYRSLLTPNEQDAYKTVINHFLQHKGFFSIPSADLSRTSIQKIIHAVNYDRPDIFWVDYWNPHIGRLPHNYVFQFEMLLDRRASESVSQTLSRRCHNLRPKIEKSSSRQQKYMQIARDIVETTSYLDSGSAFWDHTVACVLSHTAVCEGVAKLFLFLCQRYDLPCAMIGGTVNGERHAWNMVEIDNKKMFVDITDVINSPVRYFMNLQFFRTGDYMRRHGYRWNKAYEGEARCEYQNTARCAAAHHGSASALLGKVFPFATVFLRRFSLGVRSDCGSVCGGSGKRPIFVAPADSRMNLKVDGSRCEKTVKKQLV